MSNGKCYYMFNKPTGCVTARVDASHTTVMDYFKDVNNPSLHPMGRLDKDTEGLLLITDDGKFNNFLMSPENHVPKKYEFVAFGHLTEEAINEIEHGIYLTGDSKLTAPCKVCVKYEGILNDIVDLIEKLHYNKLLKNRPDSPITYGDITITEGRKHHVKRLIKHAHCSVVGLKRVSIGELELDASLPPGSYRPLTIDELSMLGWHI